MVLEDSGTVIDIREQHPVEFSDQWHKLAIDLDERIAMLDKELASIDEVIFFIPSNTIDQDNKKLKSPYLEQIKVAAKQLGFKPLGFIGAHEAVITSLQQKEAVPPSAVLVELTHEDISVFVYKAGTAAFSQSQKRSEDVFADFEQILQNIRANSMLPARIIIYGDNGLEHFYQRIMHYKWSEDIFIQIPRVEIVSEPDLLQSFDQVFSQQVHESFSSAPVLEDVGKEESVITESEPLVEQTEVVSIPDSSDEVDRKSVV